jgi:hypothetical protein
MQKGLGEPVVINPSYITEEVAYWRKANAIHKWFVANVQDGVDECQEAYVEREQLQELLEICETIIDGSVLADGVVINGYTMSAAADAAPGWVPQYEPGRVITNPELAESLLPTSNGFFFGGTEYDVYYMHDIIYTRDTLRTLLDPENEDDGDFYYHSSW